MAYLPQKKRKAKLYSTWQRSEDNKFYSSREWRAFRASYLKRHPLCIRCKQIGITMPATIVDHIVPIIQGGDKWNENNLQPLCYVHHGKKTARDGNRIKKQTNN